MTKHKVGKAYRYVGSNDMTIGYKSLEDIQAQASNGLEANIPHNLHLRKGDLLLCIGHEPTGSVETKHPVFKNIKRSNTFYWVSDYWAMKLIKPL
jgi:hypothetical protein